MDEQSTGMKGWVLALVGIGLPLLVMMAAWRAWSSTDDPIPSDYTAPKRTEARHLTAASRNQSQPQIARLTTAMLEGFDSWIETWSERIEETVNTIETAHGSSDPTKAASALLRRGEYERSVEAFDRLLVRLPNDPALLFGKAMAMSGAGQYEDALPLLERVIELEPGNVPARFNLAVTLVRVGQTPAATTVLEMIVRDQPAYWPAKFNLAILYQASGKLNEAAVLWRDVTETAPDPTTPKDQLRRADAWFHRGETALLLHLSDEAEPCFTKVLEMNPKDARAWCNIGIARAAAGQRTEAMTALAEALKLDPRLVAAINQLAMIHAANYRDANRPESRRMVLDLCRQSLAINPQQPNMSALRDALRNE